METYKNCYYDDTKLIIQEKTISFDENSDQVYKILKNKTITERWNIYN